MNSVVYDVVAKYETWQDAAEILEKLEKNYNPMHVGGLCGDLTFEIALDTKDITATLHRIVKVMKCKACLMLDVKAYTCADSYEYEKM